MTDCSFLEDLDLDGEVSFDEGARDNHAADWGAQAIGGVTPDAVVWPTSTGDVSRVLAEANDRGVPVTPYAAGTSLEGNAVPTRRGISMDFTEMDSVLEVRPDDFQIDVEPGIYGDAVNEEVERHGLFFPPLPSSGGISTIGGMIANDASGMQTVKYGEIHDWVMELEAVLADGSVVKMGSKAVKSSSGYNLKDIVVGSEGTLALVTRATLELKGIPRQIKGGRAIFESLDDASSAVFDAVRSEVDVAKIELIDPLSAEMANDYLGTDLPDAPMVFVEFHANHGVDDEIEFARGVFEEHGLVEFELGTDEEMDELWRARRELAYAVATYDPDLEPVRAGDVTVPISRYPDMIRYIKELEQEHGLLIPCFGHAGDGNVHYSVLVDTDDTDELDLGEEIYSDIVRKAIEMDGTSTGEHGIGIGKRKYLELEHGEAGVKAMKRLKDAWDPNGILNPDKIFRGTDEEEEAILERFEGDKDRARRFQS